MKIGEILFAANIISSKELDYAIALHYKEKSKIGGVLLAYGIVNHLTLYRYLALQYQCSFVDINRQPLDLSLLEASKISEYLSLQYLPFRKIGNKLLIITANVEQLLCNPNEANIEYCITSPYDLRWALEYAFRELFQKEILNQATKTLTLTQTPLFIWLVTYGKLAVIAAIIMLFGKGIGLKTFLCLSNLVYLTNNLFKCFLVIVGLLYHKAEPTLIPVSDDILPIYTILVPLYKEGNVVRALLSSLDKLDYPKTKLDIKFILEEDDYNTQYSIKAAKCAYNYEIIVVPNSLPRTKAKACNYAARFARGKYLTIYDAEDVPEIFQLRKAVYQFETSSEDLGCLQARLNYFNRKENILTQLFSLEYGLWFEFMLKGLEKIKLPIPLGGTSCHFKTNILHKICFWDAYNVTEDAELGMRLAHLGYRTQILDSLTEEESPVSLKVWLNQRTRWIKGYIQTYLINFKLALNKLREGNIHYFLTIQLFIGLPSLAFLLNPLGLVILIEIYFFPKMLNLSRWLEYLIIANWAGTFFSLIMGGLIVSYTQKWKNYLYSLLLPLYWLLHSIAALRALREMFSAPFYWHKTPHGLSKMNFK